MTIAELRPGTFLYRIVDGLLHQDNYERDGPSQRGGAARGFVRCQEGTAILRHDTILEIYARTPLEAWLRYRDGVTDDLCAAVTLVETAAARYRVAQAAVNKLQEAERTGTRGAPHDGNQAATR